MTKHMKTSRLLVGAAFVGFLLTGALAGVGYSQARATTTTGVVTIRQIINGSLSFATGTTILAADGSAAAPSYSFASNTDRGVYNDTVNSGIGFSVGGTQRVLINANGLYVNGSQTIQAGSSLSWASSGYLASPDVSLFRDAANTLALRNGTNAQALRIYKIFTDASNYERIEIGADLTGLGTGTLGVLARVAGTGTARPFYIGTNEAALVGFVTGGTTRFRIDGAAGHFQGVTATAGLGYGTGAGGTVTQITSRTTGVTLNTVNGEITLFSAAGSTTAASFTVTNSSMAATDHVELNQKSGANKYVLLVTAKAAGSFEITVYTTGGVAVEAPVISFAIVKGSAS